MKPTDFVARWCIVDNKTCSLQAKCDVCKKEIAALDILDLAFQKRIDELVKYQKEMETVWK